MPGHLPPPNPDFNRLRKVLLRQGEPDRLPLVELFPDHEIIEAVLGRAVPSSTAGQPADVRRLALDETLQFWHQMGYDYITVNAGVSLPKRRLEAADTADLSRGQRHWDDENTGVITTWEDFEHYPWPKPEEIDYFNLEYISRHLPDGMQIIYLGPGGQYENMAWLMGVTPLALALHDDPALVEAVARRIGDLLAHLFSTVAQISNVGALWLGDDLGYKTATVLSPQHLRRYVFPYQKRLAEIAHKRDLPFLLHSCGNLERVMDDLIDEVGIDAKHSFEDVILPVSAAKARWGSRVALLGGIDVDFLCRASEEQVRQHTRQVIEACAPGGGWALGTGNSVANYIPVQNYLAMVEEGLAFRY